MIPNLTDEQWQEIVERLTLHAHCKMAQLTWRGVPPSRGGTVPGGIEPEDLATDVIVALIEGTRTWDQQEQPDLLQFLKSVVDSMVSHLVECVENRVTRRIDGGSHSEPTHPVFEVPDCGPDPSTVCADREERERFQVIVLEEIGNDSLAQEVFECLEASITKPAEIAKLIGRSVREINNAQKRLRRKVESAMKKHKKR